MAPVRVLGPVFLPMLLLAVALGLSIAGDSEPSGFGEPSTGLVPGATTVTGWHEGARLVPAGFGPGDGGHGSPEALVDAMVADARRAEPEAAPWISGSIVSERPNAASARVYVPLPEYPDGWVAGELLLELAPGSDGWHVTDAHVRFHCRDAVRDSLCA